MIRRILYCLMCILVSASCSQTPSGHSKDKIAQSTVKVDTTYAPSIPEQASGIRPDHPDQTMSTRFSIQKTGKNSRQKDMSIHEVSDFKNSSFFIEVESEESFKLKDGVCDQPVSYGIDQLRLIEVDSLISDGKTYYLVLLSRVIGGESSYSLGILKIFEEIKEESLHEIGFIHFADETTRVLKVRGNKLTLHASVWVEFDANCCPSIREIGTFEIAGGQLKQLTSQFEWLE